MIEMGLKKAANNYYADVKNRFDNRGVHNEKIVFAEYAHCGSSNELSNKFCVGCSAPIDIKNIRTKIL